MSAQQSSKAQLKGCLRDHFRRYWEVYFVGSFTGLLAFDFARFTMSLVEVRTFVTGFSAVGVSFLGFAGIIYAVLYPEQRKAIARFRGESERLRQILIMLIGNRIKLNMTVKEISEEKAKIDRGLTGCALRYFQIRMSFFLSFAFIILELFAVLAFTWAQPPPWAVSLVAGLLGASVSELIYGLEISSHIPVPPEKTFIK